MCRDCTKVVHRKLASKPGESGWVDHLHSGAPAWICRRLSMLFCVSRNSKAKVSEPYRSQNTINRLALPPPFVQSRRWYAFCASGDPTRCYPPRDRGRSIRTMRSGRRTMMRQRRDCEWGAGIPALRLFCATFLELLSSRCLVPVGFLSSFR
jgi:hypothetical protein